MQAYCNYDTMRKLVEDKLVPIPRHSECPYPRIDTDSGDISFYGYNADTSTVYTPGTFVTSDDHRGLFRGSFKLLQWAESIAAANGFTLSIDIIPSPPAATKKAKQPKLANKTQVATQKTHLSLRDIMSEKRNRTTT